MFATIKLAITKVGWLIFAAVIFLSVSLWIIMSQGTYAQAVPSYCDAPYRINWPSTNPVWSLCWTPPNNSSGVDGSGLELHHVFYKGRQVFNRAHIPVLNVKYDPGGCGGSTLSYRDWQFELAPFQANNVLQPGYAEPTNPPRTVCNQPGTDVGTFSGVAVEKGANQLILTTQMSAGWYRYTQKWIFTRNGTIQPRFGFSAVTHPCTSKPHMHHAFWRFDFDIDGSTNDAIDESNSNTGWTALDLEANRLNNPQASRKWRVVDRTTNRGYEVIPGSQDGVADTFAVADVWALQYHDDEIDDGGAVSGSNQAQMNNYINDESVNSQDVVFWYRAGFRHAGGIGCEFAGPTLRLFGSW